MLNKVFAFAKPKFVAYKIQYLLNSKYLILSFSPLFFTSLLFTSGHTSEQIIVSAPGRP